jgi:transposase
MPRPRWFFPPEYKAEVVELLRSSGKTVGQVARELDLTETAVRQWVRQADLDAGRRSDGLTTAEGEDCAGCAGRSGSCVRSARSSARPRFSSPGRPVAGELLSADRGGEATPRRLPSGPRAGGGTRRLPRLGVAPTVTQGTG